MTKNEKYMLLEIERCYEQLIDALDKEMVEKVKLIAELKKQIIQIENSIKNQAAIDSRLEELLKGNNYEK